MRPPLRNRLGRVLVAGGLIQICCGGWGEMVYGFVEL